ncbi:MAG TPA: hypothetical protein VKY24_00660 [Reyranella sp.]|nr:hypothetical protein [Reyranella sp.]
MKRYLEVARNVDSDFALGVSVYYRAMSELEKIDPQESVRSVNPTIFDESLRHLDAALRGVNEMIGMIPGASDYRAVVEMRLKAGIRNAEAFRAAVSQIGEAVKASRYPTSGACIAAMSALQDLTAQAKLNAQGHQTEGL